MSTPTLPRLLAGPPDSAIPLVCPETRQPLYIRGSEILAMDPSGTVVRRWPADRRFPDLIVGGRFEDTTDAAGRRYEIESNAYSAEHYWVPLFRRLFPDYASRRRTILAMGCGIGVEVDYLVDAGFACFGVDNGNRTDDWPERRHPDGLLMANGMHLPFPDATFDAVFCGCVFPHVGVVGDSRQVADHGLADRQRLANEMVRVTRPGGQVIACSPNRRFPFDIFHWRKPGTYRVAFNPPWCRFLLSVSDFRTLFMRAGAKEVRALPVDGFWGFVTQRKTAKGRLVSWPMQTLFRAVSHPAGAFLRASPLVPWITVSCRV